MIELNFKGNFKHIERQLSRTQRKVLPKSTQQALNKAIKKVNTLAVQEIFDKTGVQKKKIRAQLKVSRSRKLSLVAKIVATGRTMNIIEFLTKAKTKIGAFKKKRGVTAKVWGKTGVLYKGSFIGRGKGSGKLLVFRRINQSDSGSEIEAVHGPNIPRAMASKAISNAMKVVGHIEFHKEWGRAIRLNLSRLKR